MAGLPGTYENMAPLNPHCFVFCVIVLQRGDSLFPECSLVHQLKCAAAVTGEDAVTDCKTVLFMFQVPLGMSCFGNRINCGTSDSGKCFSKGLALGGNERFV